MKTANPKDDLKRLQKMKVQIVEEDKDLRNRIHNLEQLKREIAQEEINIKQFDERMIKKSAKEKHPIVSQGKVKPYNALKGFMNKLRDKKAKDRSYLITMRFSNGTERSWIIVTRQEVFYYRKRGYYLRYQDNFFDLSSNRYKLYYHEDYCLPLDRNIVVFQDTGTTIPKAFLSVTPHNLKPLIKMEYVKALAQAVEISKYFKFIIILIVIALIFGMITAYGTLHGLGII